MSDSLFSVKDKVIVVTGGLGRLGKAYTRCLSERGAKVVVLDRAEAVERAPSASDSIFYCAANVTSKQELEAALSKIESKWGPPEGLINNAALDSPPDSPAEENGPFETYPEASWDQVMSVNVKGVFLACQVIGGAMSKNGKGSVINIGSIYGLVSPDQRIYEYRQQNGPPFFKPVAYSASKSALYNMTRYLATYWAKSNVRVNTLTLAGVFDHQDAQFLDNYCQKVPLGRMATAEDYFGPVVFLLSDASNYVTGANLVADGGWTAH